MMYAPLAGGHLSFGFALQAANQLHQTLRGLFIFHRWRLVLNVGKPH